MHKVITGEKSTKAQSARTLMIIISLKSDLALHYINNQGIKTLYD